jgi:hypothetical protein
MCLAKLWIRRSESGLLGKFTAPRLIGPRAAAWIGFGLIGAIIHAVLWKISEPKLLFADFYKAYYPIAQRLWHEGAQPTWQIPGTAEVGFVNIPIVGWLFVPLSFLDKESAGEAFLLLNVAATAAAWMLLLRLARPENKIGGALLFFFLANGPLVNGFREGNTTPIIFLLLVVALSLWNARSDYAAGLVLGVCAVVKLPLLLYGIYFLFRRHWRVVGGIATTISIAVIASFAIFGVDINFGWYEHCVGPFLGRVVPAFNNQSIDGFLIRLTTGADYLFYWNPVEPTAIHENFRILLFGGVFGSIFYLLSQTDGGVQTATRGGALSAEHFLEYVLVLLLSLVMSPLSWTHYYLFLLLPWGLYLGGRLSLRDDACTRWFMWSGILLSSLPVKYVLLRSDWLNFLLSRTAASAWLFGGLCMLAAMTRTIWRTSVRQMTGR